MTARRTPARRVFSRPHQSVRRCRILLAQKHDRCLRQLSPADIKIYVLCKVDQQTRTNWKFRRSKRPFSLVIHRRVHRALKNKVCSSAYDEAHRS